MATIIKHKNKNKPWTVRYYYEGSQHEKSFRTSREANDFRVKFEHDSREQIFVDPRQAKVKFADAASAWLARHPGTAKTKAIYESALRVHVLPVFGARSLADVANDRSGVEAFLRVTLPANGLGGSTVRTCYMILCAIVNEAERAGKLRQSRLRGIKMPPVVRNIEFVPLGRDQIEAVAERMPEPYGFTLYLMYGCGLRLGEALGVQARDFISEGTTLRLQRQMTADGQDYMPLKHRNAGDYRDVPVPDYVRNATPEGFTRFPPVNNRRFYDWFYANRNVSWGMSDTVTPHMLRHNFASNCLAGGIPITDVSKWLGHRSIQVTYGIYGHLVPASWDRARNVLDEEWNG